MDDGLGRKAEAEARILRAPAKSISSAPKRKASSNPPISSKTRRLNPMFAPMAYDRNPNALRRLPDTGFARECCTSVSFSVVVSVTPPTRSHSSSAREPACPSRGHNIVGIAAQDALSPCGTNPDIPCAICPAPGAGDDPHRRQPIGPPGQDLGRAVGGSVVDDDHLPWLGELLARECGELIRERSGRVEGRDHDAHGGLESRMRHGFDGHHLGEHVCGSRQYPDAAKGRDALS